MVNKFSTSIQGYKKEEVNDFVKEVTFEYENMLLRIENERLKKGYTEEDVLLALEKLSEKNTK